MYDTSNAFDTMYYMTTASGKLVVKSAITMPKAAIKFSKQLGGVKVPVYVYADKEYPIWNGNAGWIRKAHSNFKQFEAIKAYEAECANAWQTQNANFDAFAEEDEPTGDGFFGYHEHSFDNDRNSGRVVQ